MSIITLAEQTTHLKRITIKRIILPQTPHHRQLYQQWQNKFKPIRPTTQTNHQTVIKCDITRQFWYSSVLEVVFIIVTPDRRAIIVLQTLFDQFPFHQKGGVVGFNFYRFIRTGQKPLQFGGRTRRASPFGWEVARFESMADESWALLLEILGWLA